MRCNLTFNNKNEKKKLCCETIHNGIPGYWIGTVWDFNGVTRTPKQGAIACGYFVTNVLTDLGFKINPNATTEILGMIRVKNDLGGFWGSNVAFDVRQIYVRGVAGNVLRYQIGNIDYKLTPYTFYNHNPDMLISGQGVLKMKEDS